MGSDDVDQYLYVTCPPAWSLATRADLVADGVADGYLTAAQAAQDAGMSVEQYLSTPAYREAVEMRVANDLPIVGDAAGS